MNLLYFFSTPLHIFDIHHEPVFKKNYRLRRLYAVNGTYVSRRNFPATGIVIMIAADINLGSILLRIKNSIWWNHEAKILLINNAADGCQNANTFLQMLWTYNVLSAIYLCNELNSDVAMYTFNPYSKRAPIFWKQVQGNSSLNVWTMFEVVEKQLFKTLMDYRKYESLPNQIISHMFASIFSINVRYLQQLL